ncbi:MAG: hypothetical protein EA373_02095 [Oceanospirillales bacterium]|nr:MAG: hypothetical protein EA373_02095 [Oceanospirillales bacterium]
MLRDPGQNTPGEGRLNQKIKSVIYAVDFAGWVIVTIIKLSYLVLIFNKIIATLILKKQLNQNIN